MKVMAACLSAALVLVSCTPVPMYHRAGVGAARISADRTACEVQALRDAPVNNQIRERPPIWIPGRPLCNRHGHCISRPGYWADGGFYTVDVNAGLRKRVEAQCMIARGYRPVSIPRCSEAVKAAAGPAHTTRQPHLTETSCVLRNPDGSWRIVNPVVRQPG